MAKVRNQWVATTWRVRVIEARRGAALFAVALGAWGLGAATPRIMGLGALAVQ